MDGVGHGGTSNGDGQSAEVQTSRLPARRDPLSVSIQPMEAAGLVTEILDARTHKGKLITITSQVSVGIDQRIRLAWSVPSKYYGAGYRLLGFRRSDSFAADDAGGELAVHGLKIIDARNDGEKEEHVGEGECFYTFLLYGTAFLGCIALIDDIVQFSEMIPSAKHAIHRLEDTLKARTLVNKLMSMSEHHRTEAANDGRSIAKLLTEERREMDEVKATPEWKKLNKDEREFVLGAIQEKYRKRIAQG